ncbi:hypothetical protein [Mesorhizobium sp. B1-1-5]|uniref:hypothetical protein n=1 Tax=Mesorhizobium sp. B1-1-5 TaxID=2589979 RepID=UPI0015E311C6|nr:hypothetical protein [Mesorhizobium sp. B1-1-5]
MALSFNAFVDLSAAGATLPMPVTTLAEPEPMLARVVFVFSAVATSLTREALPPSASVASLSSVALAWSTPDAILVKAALDALEAVDSLFCAASALVAAADMFSRLAFAVTACELSIL